MEKYKSIKNIRSSPSSVAESLLLLLPGIGDLRREISIAEVEGLDKEFRLIAIALSWPIAHMYSLRSPLSAWELAVWLEKVSHLPDDEIVSMLGEFGGERSEFKQKGTAVNFLLDLFNGRSPSFFEFGAEVNEFFNCAKLVCNSTRELATITLNAMAGIERGDDPPFDIIEL